MDFEEARQRREAAAALASAWQRGCDGQLSADERLRLGISRAFADRRAGRVSPHPEPAVTLHLVAPLEDRQ